MEISKQIITFLKRVYIKFIFVWKKTETVCSDLCSSTDSKAVKLIKFIHFIKLLRQNQIKIAFSSF